MNERIEGLWWAARIGYNNQSCDPEVLEKFAELIVRDCALTASIMEYEGRTGIGAQLLDNFEVKSD